MWFSFSVSLPNSWLVFSGLAASVLYFIHALSLTMCAEKCHYQADEQEGGTCCREEGIFAKLEHNLKSHNSQSACSPCPRLLCLNWRQASGASAPAWGRDEIKLHVRVRTKWELIEEKMEANLLYSVFGGMLGEFLQDSQSNKQSGRKWRVSVRHSGMTIMVLQ